MKSNGKTLVRVPLVRAMIYLAEDFGLRDYKDSLTLLLNGDVWSFSERVKTLSWSDYGEYRAAYLLSEVFTKSVLFDQCTKEERIHTSLLKYWSAESACSRVNRMLACGDDAWIPLQNGDPLRVVLEDTRRKIASILGPFDFDEWIASCEFGNGANVGVTRREACLPNKIGCLKPTVTTGLKDFAMRMIGAHRAWFVQQGRDSVRFIESPCSEFDMVPKNAESERIISKEPLLNSYLQRGIGVMMRSRLLSSGTGINLHDQGINQTAAMLGSIDGKLATVDLSNASDSISRGLTEALAPDDWLAVLLATRSERGKGEGFSEEILFEKISSMGNGWTFEWETIVFYSLVWSLAKRCSLDATSIRVYGDDIICPSPLVPALDWLFALLGFKLNAKKSHFEDTGFRESCGKHYYRGCDITPFYIRSLDKGRNSLLLLTANNLRRWGSIGDPYHLDSRIKRAYEAVVSELPDWITRYRIPDGFGDGCLIGSRSEGKVNYDPVKGAWKTKSRVARPVTSATPREDHCYLAALWRLDRSEKYTPRSYRKVTGTGVRDLALKECVGLPPLSESASILYDVLYKDKLAEMFVYSGVTPWPHATRWF